MTEYQDLSELELKKVIEKAERALKAKQVLKRKEIISKIKELASSVDLEIEIVEAVNEVEKKSSRKGVKVPIKYRHPDDPEKTWTGRGVTPKWLQALLESGRQLSEFEV